MTDSANAAGSEVGTAIGVPALEPGALRWRCAAEDLPFASTREVEPVTGVIGQDNAVEALRFGLETSAPGQNIFVRGLVGTGRMTLIRRLLEEIRPSCPLARDRCYVHNFEQADRPRLITLERGRGRVLKRLFDRLADFVRDELGPALSSPQVSARRSSLDRDFERATEDVTHPFEEALREAGLRLVTFQVGNAVQSALVPVIDGKPIDPSEFEQLHAHGDISDEDFRRFQEGRSTFRQQFEEVTGRVQELRRHHGETLHAMLQEEARSLLGSMMQEIERAFPQEEVRRFLGEVIEDISQAGLESLSEERDTSRFYRVNVLLSHEPGDECPVIVENVPTVRRLLGSIDPQLEGQETIRADHLTIRSGALLRADGGYLILEVREVVSERGAWKVLLRTLRTGRLEIAPFEGPYPWGGPSLKPEPIDVNVKVILLGDAETYHVLDRFDADFPHLFKVLADFDNEILRAGGATKYAGVLARVVREEHLPHFDRTAVAALTEHGARIAGRREKLTARFGRLADIAREAAFVRQKTGSGEVTGDDVREAFRRSRSRADLPARRFREYVKDGTIRIQTSGSAVGQVNGLAVLTAGPITYGFPARITATIGAGTAGVINIEREADLSGAIHTKGFYILGGLLRHLLRTDHPLAFDASVAFEQSYGGIDGDSASGAEMCCLLSALTEVPLRQDLAMTGAIDQCGHVLAVGAVNEKIEGYFEACRDAGFTGTQGVIIPESNAGDLMLAEEVVEACRRGEFHVYAVRSIHEALEVFTAVPAGRRDGAGQYPAGTLLSLAMQRAKLFWEQASPPGRGGPEREGG
jgi:ATP-dependent Lon protease